MIRFKLRFEDLEPKLFGKNVKFPTSKRLKKK